ncbi:MAG: hypothetical protein DCC64_01865 [Planctomycetota bacterium]|nr:MAG: hypothetical protein DCC64_01865 [Planctomycetota bacterium]
MKKLYLYLDLAALKPLALGGRGIEHEQSEALAVILLMLHEGKAALLSSFALRAELRKYKNRGARAAQIKLLRGAAYSLLKATADVAQHAAKLRAAGFGHLDALHIACAAALDADALLTLDGGLLELARQNATLCAVECATPSDFVLEKKYASKGKGKGA